MSKFFTPTVRRWIYGVSIAAVPVLVYFKVLPAEAAPVILPLVLAVLNVQGTTNDDPEAYHEYE